MLTVYTDGGCSGNPGPGGWAFVLLEGAHREEKSGSEAQTTNNRMELMAVIRALEHIRSKDLPVSRKVEVITDSLYVKKGFTEWIGNWIRDGWKNAGKKLVKNRDLWLRLLAASEKLDIKWSWVMGHSGDRWNELCHSLVKSEIRRISQT